MLATLAQMELSTILTIIGMGATAIVTVIGCTWTLAAKATKIVASLDSLSRSTRDLTGRFDGHVLKSDTRDEENKIAHASLARCCDSNVSAIQSLTSRVARVETQGDNQDNCLNEVNTRLAVVESKVEA
jgi:hypothetical protein